MFESLNKPDRGEPKWYGARIIAGAVAGVLISFGLCGFGMKMGAESGLHIFTTAGLVLFGVSLLGIVVGTLVVAVEAILASRRQK